MTENRHDMVWVSQKGRLQAYGMLIEEYPGQAALLEQMLLERPGQVILPAIITRQEGVARGKCRVGWSSWELNQNGRFRVSAPVSEECIEKAWTPEEVMDMEGRHPPRLQPVLRQLRQAAWAEQIRLGLIGSAAMETVTGLPYLRDSSDIDLVVQAGSQESLSRFAAVLELLEQRFAVRMDAEVRLLQGGVKLKELLSGQKTVLVKGKESVSLLSREQGLAALSG